MRHVCVTATSDPLKSTFRERERCQRCVCGSGPKNDQNNSRCVSKSMCVISICTTHVKLGSVRSATCRAKPKPEGRAHPRRLHGALGVALPLRLSHHTPHVVYRAHYTSTCSLSLSSTLSLSRAASHLPPPTHPLSNTRTHTQHTHTPRRSSFPIPFSPPTSLSPLPTRRPQ